MKDLKHYFGSSDSKSVKESEECVNQSNVAKRKSVKVVSDDDDILNLRLSQESEDDEQPKKSRKKRRKSGKKATKKMTREELKSDSSKENSLTENSTISPVLNSSLEPVSTTLVTPPSKSLLNYFNRVDKQQHLNNTVPSHITTINVEAVVHWSPTPPPSLTEVTAVKEDEQEREKPAVKRGRGRPPLRTKLRRRVRKESDAADNETGSQSIYSEYDVITVDETPCIEVIDESVCDDVIIVSEENVVPESVKIKRDGTLSSFFPTNSMKMAAVLNARKSEFLKSGAPDSIKKLMSSKISESELTEPPFPVVNHVRQADKMNIIWNLDPWTVPVKPSDLESTLENATSWGSLMKISRSHVKKKDSPKECAIDRKRALQALKKELKDYPVARWYKAFKRSVDGLDLWTDKYKPRNVNSIVGNVGQVDNLKKWLLERKETVRRNNDEDDGSEVEFLEDSSMDARLSSNKNAILLSGPCGVGKTAAVYALAEEIGYEVLELNATCVRTGKKILHEFSEALQSHKVQANTIQFGGKDSKKDKESHEKSNLILIEDADLLFVDQDDGYQNTVATLAATSKRPVVFATNETCPKALTKTAPSLSHELQFELVESSTLTAWLRTLAIAEGIDVTPERADQITKWSNGDVRRSLLQLQLYGNLPNVRRGDDINAWQSLSEDQFDKSFELAKRLDLLSLRDTMKGAVNTQDPCRRYWDSLPRDSTILTPPLDSEVNESQVNLEQGILKCVTEGRETRLIDHERTSHDSLKYCAGVVEGILTPSMMLTRNAVSCDYLPALRHMARSERANLALQTKRNKRQFNYLSQYLNLDSKRPDETLDFLCESLAH